MSADAEKKLREQLKVALQDARKLFDDGLIDEKEFKDLKSHELTKYKQQLAAVTASSTPPAAPTSPATKTARFTQLTPIRTPLNARLRHTVRQSPASAPSYLSPATHIQPGCSKDEVLFVDSGTFQRLTTPPIFRRRSKKRRIVVPSEELNKLRHSLQPDQPKSPDS